MACMRNSKYAEWHQIKSVDDCEEGSIQVIILTFITFLYIFFFTLFSKIVSCSLSCSDDLVAESPERFTIWQRKDFPASMETLQECVPIKVSIACCTRATGKETAEA